MRHDSPPILWQGEKLQRVGDGLLTDKQRKEYSLARLVRSATVAALRQHEMVDRDYKYEHEDCFERDISSSIYNALPEAIRTQADVWFPTDVGFFHQRAGLDSKTATKGGELVFTKPLSWIDLLYPQSAVLRAGASFLSGVPLPASYPRATGGAAATFVDENPGAGVADNDPLFNQLPLVQRTLMATSSFTRQLLIAASTPVDLLVGRILAGRHAEAIDKHAIDGSGVTPFPRGILNTSGVGVVAVGTDGGVPTWANVVELETAVGDANGETGQVGYISTPGLRGKLKTVERASGSGFVWDGNQMNGAPAFASTTVPSTLTKGTSAGVCHALLFGAWPELIVAEAGAVGLLVDPFALKKRGMIEITSFQICDIALRHPAAFALIADATLT
jgi:HK97 family phage major capsid protein